MHVALVTDFPDAPVTIPGGVAGVAKYLADALAQVKGVRVSVVIPRAHRTPAAVQQWDGYKVHDAGGDWTAGIIPGRIYSATLAKRRVNRVLREIHPDIVHYHGFSDLSLSCPLPHVVTIHGIAERDALFHGNWITRRLRWLPEVLIEARARSRLENVIMISRYAQRLLAEDMSPQRLWFINNPIDASYYSVERKPQPMRVYSCSRITPLKNTLGLIEAFGLVVKDRPDATLCIAGSGEPGYESLCKRRAADLGLGQRICFLGHLSTTQNQAQLAQAHCMVLPSFQENAPLTIAEAMAAGVPVVGANVGGIPEMVADGITGVIVHPHSAAGISQGILAVLNQPDCASEMSRQSRIRAREMFWPLAVAQAHLRIYNEILQASP